MSETSSGPASQLRMSISAEAGRKRRVQGGVSTSDVITSAHVAGNADVFSQILELHVPQGSIVADVTWGKGVFWQKVDEGLYDLRATDISMGIDCRNLPYRNCEIDCVVLDPPTWKDSIAIMEARRRAAAATRRSVNTTPMETNVPDARSGTRR